MNFFFEIAKKRDCLPFEIASFFSMRMYNPLKRNLLYNRICCWIIHPKNTRTGIENPRDKPELLSV